MPDSAGLAFFSMSRITDRNPYAYRALDQREIRLLTIHAGGEEETVETTLHHAHLDGDLEYEALSYTWSKCIAKDAPDLDPESAVEVAVYPTNQSKTSFVGKPEVSKIKWKDFARHELSYLYYEVGGLREPENIVCCGHDTVVGGELYSALKSLRNSEGDRVIWIDALCINQNDNKERADQVALMAEVYSCARKVVIWLGESYSNVDPAFNTIHAITEKLMPIFKACIDKEISEVIDLKVLAFKSDKTVRKLHWDSLAELLKRSWFQRVWCIQELVNAKEAIIRLGSWEMDWKFFASVIGTIRNYDIDSQLWSRGECYGSTTVGTIEELRSTSPDQRPTLLNLLRKTRVYKSTLPVDKFFGLLNIVSDALESGVRVNYDCDSSQLYRHFAVQQMQRHNSLDLLHDCWFSQHPSPMRLPSWVPNWTQPLWHYTVSSLNLPFMAAGDTQPVFRFDDEAQTMHIKGRIVDTIAEVEKLRSVPRSKEPQDFHGDKDEAPWRSRPGETPWYKREGKSFWECFSENYVEEGRHSRKAWVTNAMAIAFPGKVCTPTQFENLWRTFVWDLTPNGLRPPSYYGESFSDWLVSITSTYAENQEHSEAKRIANISLDFREEVGDTHPITDMMAKVMQFSKANSRCYNRRFYRSKHGRFGWGVDSIEAGDIVCILDGASAPFILRPIEGGSHILIGDTYIHGLMYGEGMKDETLGRIFQLK
ncbi:hypothetical protein Vi05172_g1473 [Venturia inaequalis]|nr:hypothetical protein Vi05172_g1473 [Venturia inaequalis]